MANGTLERQNKQVLYSTLQHFMRARLGQNDKVVLVSDAALAAGCCVLLVCDVAFAARAVCTYRSEC